MLLKMNDSKLAYYCEINLYFDDGSEKHITVKEKDRLKVTYKYNGGTSIDTGILTKVTPITIGVNTDGSCDYGCSCGCGCKSTALLSLDVSKEYNSNIKNIMLSDVLDIIKLDEEDGKLPATSENIADVIANAKYGDTIMLQSDIYTEDITIDKPLTIIGTSNGVSVITGKVTVTAPDVTITGCTFNMDEDLEANDGAVVVTCNGSFTFTNNTMMATATSIRTAVLCNIKGVVNFSGNTFIDVKDSVVYNWVEVGLNREYPIATGSKFNSNNFVGKPKHNHFSLYTFENNAEIEMSNNKFEWSVNALRISNTTSAAVNFTMYNNEYENTDDTDNYIYAGLLFFQDYAAKGTTMDFTRMNVAIVNLIGPGGNKMLSNVMGTIDQVYYVYDDQDGIITDTNQPNVTFA